MQRMNQKHIYIDSPSKSTHSESNNFLYDKKSIEQSMHNEKEEKEIYILFQNKKIIIKFEKNEENSLTCGWLLSETIRKIKDYRANQQNNSEISEIIGLETKDNILSINYWLQFFEKNINVLRNEIILIPIFSEIIFGLKNTNIEHFKFIKLIGKGNYSNVFLARKKENGKYYSIKVIEKKCMIQKDKEELIFNEKTIMTKLNHQFIIKLNSCFQTKKKLFFVMEFCPGGDLFFHLRKKKGISEDEARLYFYEILLALDYLHKNKIIYVDLKPENILLDLDGHLKLADFGLARICSENSDTVPFDYFRGSLLYASPEMLSQQSYNQTIDYYSLGILLYEMVIGKTPFIINNFDGMIDQIMNKTISFPQNKCSKSFQSLIYGLTEKNRNNRLGNNNGINEILSHEWCKNFNLKKIMNKNFGNPAIQLNLYQNNFDQEYLEQDDDTIYELYSGDLGFEINNYECKSENVDYGIYEKFSNFSFNSEIINEENDSNIINKPKIRNTFPKIIKKNEIKKKNNNKIFSLNNFFFAQEYDYELKNDLDKIENELLIKKIKPYQHFKNNLPDFSYKKILSQNGDQNENIKVNPTKFIPKNNRILPRIKESFEGYNKDLQEEINLLSESEIYKKKIINHQMKMTPSHYSHTGNDEEESDNESIYHTALEINEFSEEKESNNGSVAKLYNFLQFVKDKD